MKALAQSPKNRALERSSAALADRGLAQERGAEPGQAAEERSAAAGGHTFSDIFALPTRGAIHQPDDAIQSSAQACCAKCEHERAAGDGSGAACASTSPEGSRRRWPLPPALRTLDVSAPRDARERAADRLAARAQSAQAPPPRGPMLHEPMLNGRTPPTADPLVASGGALPAPLRDELGVAFGRDFSGVRVFHDGTAAAAADELGATAFTVGQNIYFNRGRYQPASSQGRSLLMHELAHTIQQRGQPLAIQRSTAGRCAGAFENIDEQREELTRVGSAAHKQIQAFFRAELANERRVPRASKDYRDVPSPGPKVPRGFVDLVKFGRLRAEIGEIKSVEGLPYALRDVIHYRTRGAQAASRLLGLSPRSDPADGPDREWDEHWFGGAIERQHKEPDLPPLTSVIPKSPTELGPFWGDPKKDLLCELRPGGAVLYWCTGREEKKKKQPQRQVAAKPQEKENQQPQRRVPAQVAGADPAFAEYAQRMRPPLILPGQQFIVAFRDEIYTGAVNEMNRRHFEQTKRLLQVDPRGVPLFAVQAPLIPIAVVAGAIELVIVGGMIVAAIVVAAPEVAVGAAGAATTAEVGTGAAVAAETGAGAAAPTLTVLQGGAAATGGTAAASGTAAAAGGGAAAITFDKAAAAVVIAKLVAGGSSEAEAAEAVRPLVGKRIAVVVEVSRRGGIQAYKPGQVVSTEPGGVYRAAIALTAGEGP